MCKFASFKHCPSTGEIAVDDLESHGNTEKELKLDPKIWQDGHYLSNGEIELRLTSDDKVDPVEYKTAFVNRFPTFISFFNWTFEKVIKNGKYNGSLYLNSLTSAAGLKLPQKVGSLDLRSLTSAAGLKLPQEVSGYLDLRDNVRAELDK